MLDVYLTVDVEIWCDGWRDIDRKFSTAFDRYIYGTTSSGNYGLPYQLSRLADHGLRGVFFVEPLFSSRFGLEPLCEIVELIQDAGQDVELHLHPEWVTESREQLLPNVERKHAFLHSYTREEQTKLIAVGAKMLRDAGAQKINAFRAGSFGLNRHSLFALADNDIFVDSSYNGATGGQHSGVLPGTVMTVPVVCDGVAEYPITVYHDGRKLRHAQLTACSSSEMEGLLWQALEQGRQSFVLVSHRFELLNVAKTRADPVVIKRFDALCRFLDRNRDCFRTVGFDGKPASASVTQPAPLTSPLHRTGARWLEQAYRRIYG